VRIGRGDKVRTAKPNHFDGIRFAGFKGFQTMVRMTVFNITGKADILFVRYIYLVVPGEAGCFGSYPSVKPSNSVPPGTSKLLYRRHGNQGMHKLNAVRV
jgi:hypothetical protein